MASWSLQLEYINNPHEDNDLCFSHTLPEALGKHLQAFSKHILNLLKESRDTHHFLLSVSAYLTSAETTDTNNDPDFLAERDCDKTVVSLTITR